MTELVLESIVDNSNFTPLQMRKIKNLKWARDNAEDLPYLIVDGKVISFKKMWSKKLSELICKYLKLN